MDKLSIENSLLLPCLADGWKLDTVKEPARLRHQKSRQQYEINAITAMILERCDGERNLVDIIESLSELYPDSAGAIQGDVESLLRELHEKGVVSFTPTQTREVFEKPERSPSRPEKKKLCIGMATYDDYDGVYFSVQAIRMYHPEVLDEIEIVVVDNNPSGACAQPLKRLGNWISNYRYIPYDAIRGTAIKGVVFREANADFVMCIDSHVMIVPGAISRLLAYFEAHPETQDLLQGPLVSDDLHTLSTHFKPGWSGGMYGTWSHDERGRNPDAEPFDIPMQGMGLFACAKSAWPGFNSRFFGFVGEEGYVHEKVRQAGGRTLCLPFLRWLHRFERPMGVRYRITWEDRIRNYIIAYDELGLEMDELIEHFKQHVGKSQTKATVERTFKEMASPLYACDLVFCILGEGALGHWPQVQNFLSTYEVHHRIRTIDPDPLSEEPGYGRIMAHHYALREAREAGSRNVVILDVTQLDELRLSELDVDRLAHLENEASACLRLESAVQTGSSSDSGMPQAIACGHALFDVLLDMIPDTEEEIQHWLESGNDLVSSYEGVSVSSKQGEKERTRTESAMA